MFGSEPAALYGRRVDALRISRQQRYADAASRSATARISVMSLHDLAMRDLPHHVAGRVADNDACAVGRDADGPATSRFAPSSTVPIGRRRAALSRRRRRRESCRRRHRRPCGGTMLQRDRVGRRAGGHRRAAPCTAVGHLLAAPRRRPGSRPSTSRSLSRTTMRLFQKSAM